MTKQEFIIKLKEKKNAGISANQAFMQMILEIQPRLKTAEKYDSTNLSILCAAMFEVYGITLHDLALDLKEAGFDILETAPALRESVQENESDVSALDLGSVLLEEDIYPGTTKDTMNEALKKSNYTDLEIEKALKILYPIIITVDSKQSWQYTGIDVQADEKVTIEYQSGTWRVSPYISSCNADGVYGTRGKLGYAMIGAPEGAVIGKIDQRIFLVGKKADTPLDAKGKLYLCPNDDLDSKYGLGFADNIGSITMKITVKLR